MSGARVELLPEAQLEIEEAIDWYLARSVRAAEGLLRELDRGFDRIRRSPSACPSFEAETRRYILAKYPYSIIFRQSPERFEIVAVAHHKRRPRYWIAR